MNQKFSKNKLYTSLLTCAVLFWSGLVMATNYGALAAEPPSSGSAFTVCGLAVSAANSNYDANAGKYEITFDITNTKNTQVTVDAEKSSCRCEEANGQLSSDLGYDFNWHVCVGDWPNPLRNSTDMTDKNNCKFNTESFSLSPGQKTTKTVTVTTPTEVPEKDCGSYQADYFFKTVTDASGVVCDVDSDPGRPSFDGTAFGGQYGVLFTGNSGRKDCSLNEPPICNIKTVPSPASGTAPLSVFFDGGGSTADTSIATYLWEVSDGTFAGSPTFTHTFNTPGDYEVSLVVKDSEGLSSSLCKTPVHVSSTPPTYVCNNKSYTCELTNSTAPGDRGSACNGPGDDAKCVATNFICDTRTQSCEDRTLVPVGSQGVACNSYSDDAKCVVPSDYICNIRSYTCELTANTPPADRGVACTGAGDDAKCVATNFICDTRSKTCEDANFVPVGSRGASCTSFSDDQKCATPPDYVCNTATQSCVLSSTCPIGDRGQACSGPNDTICSNPQYVCNNKTYTCDLLNITPPSDRGASCAGTHDFSKCQPSLFICDTRSKSCEDKNSVPGQYQGKSCSSFTDDSTCIPSISGPQIIQEPWVLHSKALGVYRKTIRLISGGPVDSWIISGKLSTISESSNQITFEAQNGTCAQVSFRVGATTYGPYSAGCTPSQ